MEHISNLVNSENYQPSSSCSRPLDATRSGDHVRSVLSERVINRIWEKMSAIYGHRWVSAYGVHVDESGKLSQAAETWSMGLSGLSREQLAHGFEYLLKNGKEWPPTLPEFREMCVQASTDVPGLHEVVSILANARSREGSLVDRYRHPLVLAIALEVDMHALRTASTTKAEAMVGPAYKRLVAAGWPEWPEHAFDRVKSIGHDKPVSRQAARDGLAMMRAALGYGGCGNVVC